MTSEEQIEANRQNALKSTGPKDVSNTKLNAIQHGILAKTIVLEDSPFNEKTEDFGELQKQFEDDIEPKNIIERKLVETMVICCWKLRRIERAERACLRVDAKSIEDNIRSAYSIGGFGRDFKDWGLDFIEKRTQDAYTELFDIEKKNIDMEKYRKKTEYQGLDDKQILKKAKQDVEMTIKLLETLEDAKIERMNKEIAIEIEAANIPSGSRLENLIRYKTSVERSFYRALNQLMQLRGKPSIDVQIN